MTSPEEIKERNRRLKSRNAALALILTAFVLLFYAVTLVKGIPLLQRQL